MPRAHTHRLVARRAALLLLALPTLPAGCRSWHAQPLPATGAPAQPVDGRARVRRTDGTREEVTHVRLERDTLHAVRRGGTTPRAAVAVPFDSVRALEVRRLSVGRTLGLVAGVGLALFLGQP